MTIINKDEIKDLHECIYPDLAWEAVKLGLVAGYKLSDGIYLKPKQNISREENWLMDLRQNTLLNTFVNHDVPSLVQKVMPAIVRIWSKSGVGSGSFIAPDLILTNAHVVKDQPTVKVDIFGEPEKRLECRVIKRGGSAPGQLDLALIKYPVERFPFLELTTEVKQGEFCLVCGNPLGEWHSVSAGIVTRFGGEYLQTDALVNPGNSGGATVNVEGKLIGVPTMKIVGDGIDNHNYSIMTYKVLEFLQGVI